MKTFLITLSIELFLAWVGGCDFHRSADMGWGLLMMILFALLVSFAAGPWEEE